MTENQESEALAKYLRNNWYMFTHIANESWLPTKVAMKAWARKKRMWLSPWFPDYCIVLKIWSLFFIELKKKRTRKKNGEYKALSTDHIVVSKEQEHWKTQLNTIPNVQCNICYWHEESISIIKELDNISS